MLSQKDNERYTRVGKGTPMGELMRRYWHPLAGTSQMMGEDPTMAVRLLGEGPRPLPDAGQRVRAHRAALRPPRRRSALRHP